MVGFRTIVAWVLALLALAPAAQAQTKLSVGYGIASDFLAVLTARDEGIFAKHGLDVDMTLLTNGGLAPQALVSGSVQISFNTGPVLMLGVDGGIDMVVISGVSRIQKINPHSALVTRDGVTVAQPADLIGKRVADPGINSSLDLVMKKWLLDGGVKPAQVTVVELPFPLMGDSLKSAQIDAAFPVEPMLGRILASGAGTKSVDIQSAVSPDFAATFWSATREWATAHPQAVTAFRDSLGDALSYIREHPDDAKAIALKYFHYNDPSPPEASLAVKLSDLQFWVDICTELDLIRKPVDVAALVFPGTPMAK
ncbi:MAG TPA: ABC transporter substrate-binding protein [Stellaceae bacterium]|jgi:NitT/TauT family transport system substrate-binding protein|nr:ABC transporter substrate-binding protein [Stellaceae bacterium]